MIDIQLTYYYFLVEFLELYVLIFSILGYLTLLSLIFLILFFFNVTRITNLLDLKLLNSFNFFNSTIVVSFLSLAGMPPFLGFLGKFLLFISLFNKNHYLFLFIFTILNVFMIYFYIQNTRFLLKKINLLGLNIQNYFNEFVIANFSFLNLFNFLNIFSFLLIDTILMFLAYFCLL